MSDRRTGPVSRRTVLSGLGTVGLAGAFGGFGTLALARDTESVGNHVEAGVLDLELCWDDGPGECEPGDDVVTVPITVAEKGDSGSATVRYLLPDDGRNNPGYVWFRTSCAVDACGLERAVDVTLWHDEDCDGVRDSGETRVEQGSLCETLDRLHDGVLLSADGTNGSGAPLRPGEVRCLGLEWELVDPVCGTDEVEVAFQFRAEQARHTATPVSPWEGATCDVDCDDTSGCVECVDAGGISFLAFCGPEELAPADLALTVSAVNPDGEPVGFDWESTKPVDRVVMKLGNGYGAAKEGASTGGEFAMYEFGRPVDVRDGPGGGSHGSVLSGEGSLVVDGEPHDPCPDGFGVKYEIDGEVWERV